MKMDVEINVRTVITRIEHCFYIFYILLTVHHVMILGE